MDPLDAQNMIEQMRNTALLRVLQKTVAKHGPD